MFVIEGDSDVLFSCWKELERDELGSAGGGVPNVPWELQIDELKSMKKAPSGPSRALWISCGYT